MNIHSPPYNLNESYIFKLSFKKKKKKKKMESFDAKRSFV